MEINDKATQNTGNAVNALCAECSKCKCRQESRQEMAAADPKRVDSAAKTIAKKERKSKTSKNINKSVESYKEKSLVLKRSWNKSLGLSIVFVFPGILVSKVAEDSLAFGVLKVGDEIQRVDGQRVKDKEKCIKLIRSVLEKKGEVTIDVIRPGTSDAMSSIWRDIVLSQSPSVYKIPPIPSTWKEE